MVTGFALVVTACSDAVSIPNEPPSIGGVDAIACADGTCEVVLRVIDADADPVDLAVECLRASGTCTLTDELTGECSREAMVALARLKNPETTQALLGLFERPDVRAQTLHLVFWTLGEMKDPAAVPGLLIQLRAGDVDRARRAAEALGSIGNRSAVRPLIEQLAHPDAGVVDMVVWALEKITGQTFEKDRAQWESWLEQNPY